MRIASLQKPTLITEGWNDPRLTLLEERVIIPFIKDVEKYITEAQLTPDQIQQLFTNVEQGATSAGGNRTAIGKGADAASFIADKMKELKDAVANSGPVQNIDAKFNDLKAKIGEKDSKVVSAVKAVSDWAKENPGKASAAVAVLTIAAGMAGGPLGGAIGGFLARATKDLLKGENLSTAVGSSLKTAAIGAVVGALGDAVSADVTPPEVDGGAEIATASVDSADIDTTAAVKDVDGAEGLSSEQLLQQTFENMDEFVDYSAKEMLKEIGKDLSPEQFEKFKESLVVQGDITQGSASIAMPEGAGFVRGEIYLTPDEMQGYKSVVDNSEGAFTGKGALSPETTKWLEQNVEGFKGEGGTNVVPDKPDADLDAAIGGDETSAGSKVKNAADDFDSGTSAKDDPDFKGGSDAKDEFKGGTDARDDDAFKPERKPDDFDELSADDKVDVLLDVPPGQWTEADYKLMKDQDILGPMDAQTYFANNPDKIPDDAKSSMVKMKQFLSTEVGDSYDKANSSQRTRIAKMLMQLTKAESIAYTGQKLSEGQIYLLVDRLVKANNHMLENNLMFESAFAAVSYYHRNTPLEEGPMDVLKKAGGAIAKGAKAVGSALKPKLDIAKGAIKGAAKQVTTKVTAEKLMNAWKKAGSPTDSDEIYNIIKGMGVGDDVIKGTYDSMKIKPPVSAEEPAEPEADTNQDATGGSVDTPADPNAPEQGELDLDGTDDAPATNDGPTDPELEKQIGDAKQDAAAKKGRGLSPEEEAQIEKDVTDKFEKSKPADATAEPTAQDPTQSDEPTTGGSVDTPPTQQDAPQTAQGTDEPAPSGTQEPAGTPATIDINKLANDIKKAGKPVIDAVKQKLTA
jgi:hypothetical protein